MKAAVLHASGGPLVVEERPRPAPGHGEVLVRVRACGLGLTLVWNRNGRRETRLPRVIGHELAGDVVEVGPGAGGVAPGDRVAAYYYLTCGTCPRCARGQENLCERRRGQVGKEIDGGLAEYVCLPAANVVPLPPGIGYVDAAVAADAIATPVHVLRARARVAPGEVVLVVGAGGGVGVHMVQVARYLGARVIAVDISPAKLALAAEAGASDVIDAMTSDFAVEARRLTEGRGADVVIEMVGRPETLGKSAASLAADGRLVLVGTYDRGAELPVRHDTLREGVVMGSQYCTRAELAETLSLVADGRLRPVVTRTCGLAEADGVLRQIEAMALAGRACVVFE
jgi:propanol-preferring alcohol dehydrogenase